MKFKIEVGPLSAEYEGPEEFFKESIAGFIESFVEKAGAGARVAQTEVLLGETPSTSTTLVPHRHSTNTVAKLLDAKTGPDLIMAAAAKKILIDGDSVITRQTILAEIRGATSYFKSTYDSNLSAYLDNLTKSDKLRLISDGTYGIPAKVRDSIEPKLDEQ